ncbi:hypothetical protein AAES_119399 [Amazona aestiva]|uniref:Uncharacterized protein n=1 Tax=Amazona aestiva TaxID=12930 RepID=A0A0Q3M6F4_AMAAE|nr:hypothetical protein AAES_119399 [Amazona aestiva]
MTRTEWRVYTVLGLKGPIDTLNREAQKQNLSTGPLIIDIDGSSFSKRNSRMKKGHFPDHVEENLINGSTGRTEEVNISEEMEASG